MYICLFELVVWFEIYVSKHITNYNYLKAGFVTTPKTYEPKHTTTTQPISTSDHLWTLLTSSHTTPSWSVTLVTAPPISMPLFSARAPFRSDASPWYLYLFILICATPWCLFLLYDALSWSVPVYNAWHCSVPPVLFVFIYGHRAQITCSL